MGMIVNPKEDSGDAGHPRCTAGQKLIAVVGLWMGKSSNGNPMANVHCVCLRDMENKGEEGFDVWVNLPLIESVKWKIANFADAAGYAQPFDAHSKEQLTKALTNYPLVVTLEPNTYTRDGKEKTNYQVTKYEQYTGDPDDGWDPIMNDANARLKDTLKRLAEKAKGGGNGGGGWNRGDQPPPPEPDASDYSEDPPF